jgi:hypothetical protein
VGVWVLADGHLKRVRVQPGVTDGTMTAVTGELQEGAQIVTGVNAQAVATAPQASGSPLLPQRLRGNRSGQTRQGGAR